MNGKRQHKKRYRKNSSSYFMTSVNVDLCMIYKSAVLLHDVCYVFTLITAC